MRLAIALLAACTSGAPAQNRQVYPCSGPPPPADSSVTIVHDEKDCKVCQHACLYCPANPAAADEWEVISGTCVDGG